MPSRPEGRPRDSAQACDRGHLLQVTGSQHSEGPLEPCPQPVGSQAPGGALLLKLGWPAAAPCFPAAPAAPGSSWPRVVGHGLSVWSQAPGSTSRAVSS